MDDTHKLEPGQEVNLDEMTADSKDCHDNRKQAEKEFKILRKEFRDLQARLYAEDQRQMLIDFQAVDAGGKDGTIRAITQGVRVSSTWKNASSGTNIWLRTKR